MKRMCPAAVLLKLDCAHSSSRDLVKNGDPDPGPGIFHGYAELFSWKLRVEKGNVCTHMHTHTQPDARLLSI